MPMIGPCIASACCSKENYMAAALAAFNYTPRVRIACGLDKPSVGTFSSGK